MPTALRREAVRKFRQVGLWGTFKHGTAKILREARGFVASPPTSVDRFDDQYGTNTSGIVGVGSLDISDDQMLHAIQYAPISEEEFDRLMQEIPVSADGRIFVDLGSGKGRALLLASRYPFKRIIGVELSRMLHDIAVHNIEVFRDPRQQCRDIQSICEDASAFEIPAGPLLFFLFHPFDDEIIRSVVAHVEVSLRMSPRQIYVWYVRPDFRKAFDVSSCLRVLKETGRYVFYEGTPAARL